MNSNKPILSLPMLVIHVAIGFVIAQSPVAAKIWCVAILIMGIHQIYSNKNGNEEALLWSAYIAAADVPLRACEGALLWEIGKLGIVIFLLSGLLINRGSKRKTPSSAIAMALLLIPGILTTFTWSNNVREDLTFNISGMVCLLFSMIYLYRKRISFNTLKSVFAYSLLPIVVLSIVLFFRTPSIDAIEFTSSANFATSGGFGPNQSEHLLTFENPCLTEEERAEGQLSVANKNFGGKLNFVFIGRLEDAKGVHRILQVFSNLENPRIGQVHLIGDGPKRAEYEEFARNNCKQDVVFHGFLKKDEINKVLSPSHVFLLPSDSEGFPKVVAEAANFGLIPIVSDMSCIGQYVIEGETGYLIPPKDTDALEKAVCKILDLSEEKLSYISKNCFDMASSFTFGHYNDRIKKSLL